jgi:hypothetical protein
MLSSLEFVDNPKSMDDPYPGVWAPFMVVGLAQRAGNYSTEIRKTEPCCRKILHHQLSPPTSTTIGLASGTTLPAVLLAGSPRQRLAKIRQFSR